MNKFNPDYKVHPGEYLREIFETAVDYLIENIILMDTETFKKISKMTREKLPVDKEMAAALEKLTGVSAEIWLNMSKNYYKNT